MNERVHARTKRMASSVSCAELGSSIGRCLNVTTFRLFIMHDRRMKLELTALLVKLRSWLSCTPS
jgi:hypothetical protein